MPQRSNLTIISKLLCSSAIAILSGCAVPDRQHSIVVSVPDQKMVVFDCGRPIADYDISTSKFGVGDVPGSFATPLGALEIAKKIGGHSSSGSVFRNRKPTGEILAANTPGRDPIVTRILWLRGLEPENANAFARTIYIHGTPEESKVGTPASYGCIRMRSSDIMNLFKTVGVGARVEIIDVPLVAPSSAPSPAEIPLG